MSLLSRRGRTVRFRSLEVLESCRERAGRCGWRQQRGRQPRNRLHSRGVDCGPDRWRRRAGLYGPVVPTLGADRKCGPDAQRHDGVGGIGAVWGHLDPAGHRGDRADHRYGRGREHHHLRAHSRGTQARHRAPKGGVLSVGTRDKGGK